MPTRIWITTLLDGDLPMRQVAFTSEPAARDYFGELVEEATGGDPRRGYDASGGDFNVATSTAVHVLASQVVIRLAEVELVHA